MTICNINGRRWGIIAVLLVLVLSPIGFGLFGKVAEAGVSVLACSLALAFLNLDQFKRFKGGGFEAEMKDQVDAMVASESEPEQESERCSVYVESYGLDPAARQIVDALNSSQYTWRSLGGICKEVGYTRPTILKHLQWLESAGLVLKVGVGRRVNWGLTEKGREVALHQRATKS